MRASNGRGQAHGNKYFFDRIPLGTSKCYEWPPGEDRDIFHRRVTSAAWMHGRNKKVAVMVRKVSIGVQVWRLR